LEAIPSSWESTSVGDAIRDIHPGFASGVHNQEGLGIPHLRPMNVDREGKLDLTVVKYVSPENPLRIRAGDVLFNNTNSAELIGKTTHIGIAAELAFSNHMTRLRPGHGIDPRFVGYQLHFLWMTGYFLHRCTHHVNQASISSSTLAETVPLVVPPSLEQVRIVEEIEKQFTRLDAAVAALKRVQADLQRYRAAVLKAVCEGSLVPTEAALARREGRSYEPASVLLERILAERRSRWGATAVAKQQGMGVNRKSQYAEPSAVATDDRTQVPDGWIKATVEQVSSLVQYGSSAKTNEDSDGVAVLRMGNLTGDGRLDVAKLKYLPKNHDEFPGLLLDEGDLLFNRTNSAELVGKSAVYAGNPSPCSFASYLIRVKTVRGCDSRYVALCLNSNLGRTWIKSVVSQQVGQANVNGTKLQAFVFPMPPQSEQSRILAEVERRLSIIDEHEVLVEKDLIRADRLRQAILREAFAGKLVPQDPNDEPASALLERIHAERKAEPKASPDRGRWKKEAQHVS